MGTNSATAMQKIIDGMLTAGCEATVASFLALTEKVRVWNKCQVKLTLEQLDPAWVQPTRF